MLVMDRAGFPPLRRPSRAPRLALVLCGLLPLGCAQLPAVGAAQPPSPVTRAANPAQGPLARLGTPQELPPPGGLPPTHLPHPAQLHPPAHLTFQEPLTPRQVPVNLDTVLRLSQDQNTRIHIAREKVREACAGVDLAGKAWLPDLWLGGSWYRHEGGIQNEDGTVTHSSFGSLF